MAIPPATDETKKSADARARLPDRSGKAVEALSAPELLKEITHQVRSLVTAQVDLARAELRANLSSEATTVAGLGLAAVAGITTVNLLLVTAILALTAVLPAWAAGLCVSGAVLLFAAIAGAVGWSKRVKRPMARTRRELDEDVEFAKERVV